MPEIIWNKSFVNGYIMAVRDVTSVTHEAQDEAEEILELENLTDKQKAILIRAQLNECFE